MLYKATSRGSFETELSGMERNRGEITGSILI